MENHFLKICNESAIRLLDGVGEYVKVPLTGFLFLNTFLPTANFKQSEKSFNLEKLYAFDSDTEVACIPRKSVIYYLYNVLSQFSYSELDEGAKKIIDILLLVNKDSS